MAREVLPDSLWPRIVPLLPKRRRNRHVRFAGRKPWEPRHILTGILFVLRTGIPWPMLPAAQDFPSGYTCRRKLRQWHRRGVWRRLLEVLLTELQAARQSDWRRAIVDRAAVRAPSLDAHGGETR